MNVKIRPGITAHHRPKPLKPLKRASPTTEFRKLACTITILPGSVFKVQGWEDRAALTPSACTDYTTLNHRSPSESLSGTSLNFWTHSSSGGYNSGSLNSESGPGPPPLQSLSKMVAGPLKQTVGDTFTFRLLSKYPKCCVSGNIDCWDGC